MDRDTFNAIKGLDEAIERVAHNQSKAREDASGDRIHTDARLAAIEESVTEIAAELGRVTESVDKLTVAVQLLVDNALGKPLDKQKAEELSPLYRLHG